jgi:hypothetical protein
VAEGSEVESARHAEGGDLPIKRKLGAHNNAKTCYTIKRLISVTEILLSGIAGDVRKRWCW